jgi:dUTPase
MNEMVMDFLKHPQVEFYFNDEQLFASYRTNECFEESEIIADKIGLKCEIHQTGETISIIWGSSEALEIANYLGENKLMNATSIFAPIQYIGTLKYQLCHNLAKPPIKAHASDSGFDLSLVDIVKTNDNLGVTWYTTGVKVVPPHGYYFDLVPRSSISKTGYSLANSVGIIDQSYRGEIIVALKKTKNAEDLVLPAKLVQIVPRLVNHMFTKEIENIESFETTRGNEGFGSTNI